MSRIVKAASAQMGPIPKSQSRKQAVSRLVAMMREAKGRGAELVVFPELAFTTFFPRWMIEDEAELDSYYETEMPGPETAPLFEESKKLGVGFYISYAELVNEGGRRRRFNTSIIVDRNGEIVGKYRKVHLPGHSEPQPGESTSTWRSAISSPATLASAYGGHSAASWACASATTGAGPKPIGSWACRASRWSCSATTRPSTTPAMPISTG